MVQYHPLYSGYRPLGDGTAPDMLPYLSPTSLFREEEERIRARTASNWGEYTDGSLSRQELLQRWQEPVSEDNSNQNSRVAIASTNIETTTAVPSTGDQGPTSSGTRYPNYRGGVSYQPRLTSKFPRRPHQLEQYFQSRRVRYQIPVHSTVRVDRKPRRKRSKGANAEYSRPAIWPVA